MALEYWYKNVRRQFFSTMEFGELLYQGVLDKLALAKKERSSRLIAMVEKVAPAHEKCRCQTGAEKRLCELHANIGEVCGLFKEGVSDPKETELAEHFLNAFEKHRGLNGDYIQVIQSMPETISQDGVRWLQHITDALCKKAGTLLSSFALF